MSLMLSSGWQTCTKAEEAPWLMFIQEILQCTNVWSAAVVVTRSIKSSEMVPLPLFSKMSNIRWTTSEQMNNIIWPIGSWLCGEIRSWAHPKHPRDHLRSELWKPNFRSEITGATSLLILSRYSLFIFCLSWRRCRWITSYIEDQCNKS